MLSLRNVSFGYQKEHFILKDISLTFPSGEMVGILGPNGAGKTTLLKCMNHIYPPSQGDVFLQDLSLNRLSRSEIARKIAYVPQQEEAIFGLNVMDAVLLGRLPYRKYRWQEEDYQMVYTILEKMAMEDFAVRDLRTLSGGEKQKVFIARGLVCLPQILLLDEPISALDVKNQLFVLQFLKNLACYEGKTVITTLHDLNLAAMFCDRIILQTSGQICADGPTSAVITEENLWKVYGIRTKVTIEENRPHIRILNL